MIPKNYIHSEKNYFLLTAAKTAVTTYIVGMVILAIKSLSAPSLTVRIRKTWNDGTIKVVDCNGNTCNGTMTYSNGIIKQGEWVGNRFIGIMTFPDKYKSRVFKGLMVDGKRVNGTEEYASGEKYTGLYLHGSQHDEKGVYTSGSITYTGPFVDGKKHGCMQVTNHETQVTKTKWFQNDKYLTNPPSTCMPLPAQPSIAEKNQWGENPAADWDFPNSANHVKTRPTGKTDIDNLWMLGLATTVVLMILLFLTHYRSKTTNPAINTNKKDVVKNQTKTPKRDTERKKNKKKKTSKKKRKNQQEQPTETTKIKQQERNAKTTTKKRQKKRVNLKRKNSTKKRGENESQSLPKTKNTIKPKEKIPLPPYLLTLFNSIKNDPVLQKVSSRKLKNLLLQLVKLTVSKVPENNKDIKNFKIWHKGDVWEFDFSDTRDKKKLETNLEIAKDFFTKITIADGNIAALT